ncbi:rubrerythrin [Actinopolyspora lacussalsi]|nr:rubrerythrin [Actinopolyspora lacussalsi]
MSSTELSGTSEQAARKALEAEHAAVWLYGLATAFTEDSKVRSGIDEAAATHREHRDRTRGLLRAAGVAPPSAEPAYRPPKTVTDQNSALRALLAAEQDCSIGWLAVLERSENRQLSELALTCLTDAATRATRWRSRLGIEPSASAFPGRE